MSKLFFVLTSLLMLAVLARILLSFTYPAVLKNGQQLNFTTRIQSAPTYSFGRISFPVSYANGFGSTTLQIITDNDTLVYGQEIKISGRVKEKVLQNKRPVMTMYFPIIASTNSPTEMPMRFAQEIRGRVMSTYARALSQDEAGLLVGIVLGVKEPMSKSLTNAFKITGVMHVIAASGMNVTMVSGFLVSLLGRVFRRRHVCTLTILVLGIYCYLAGFQPSIVRATIMGVLMLLGQVWGRQYSGFYGLFLAGSGMLLLNPTLVQDVGFQLSFASSLGILTLHPHISHVPFLGEDLATTISAQVATLPILLVTFGQYGLLSILANALVLWTVAPLMILGGIGALIGLVLQPLGSILSLLSLPLLWYFEKVILWLGNFGWTISLSSIPIVLVVGYYGIIMSAVLFLKIRKSSIDQV